MTLTPGGAGRGGGFLFVGLVLFLVYLVIDRLEGASRLVGITVLLAIAALLFLNVARRR